MHFKGAIILATVLLANNVYAVPTFINGFTIAGNTGATTTSSWCWSATTEASASARP